MIVRVFLACPCFLLLGIVGMRSSHDNLAMPRRLAAVEVPQEIDPKPLYTKLCEPCHGPNGQAPAPEMGFVARAWKHGTSTPDIVKAITVGVPGTAMLPFKGKLKDPEIAALARYVRSLDKRLKPEKGGGG